MQSGVNPDIWKSVGNITCRAVVDRPGGGWLMRSPAKATNGSSPPRRDVGKSALLCLRGTRATHPWGTPDAPVHELTSVSDQPSSALKRWAQRQEIPLSTACKTVVNPATFDWQTAGRLRRFRDRQQGAVRRSANTRQRCGTIDGWALDRRVLAFPSLFAVRRATLLFVSPARVACRRATRHLSP